MRNWNLRMVAITSYMQRFQTTYEELKPSEGSGETNDISRFQTTYEELKPLARMRQIAFFSLPDYLWGIETWYKYTSTPKNIRFQTTYEELKLDQVRANGEVSFVLPDYLWGIETQSGRTAGGQSWSGFQTTYEELKPIKHAIIWYYIASRLPMRNWNWF